MTDKAIRKALRVLTAANPPKFCELKCQHNAAQNNDRCQGADDDDGLNNLRYPVRQYSPQPISRGMRNIA
jgi:hypothetical protein